MRSYLEIARLDHWIKNFFAIPGLFLAFFSSQYVNYTFINLSLRIFIAIFALGLGSSANYSLNEWLDRESDRAHPVKKYRPCAQGKINGKVLYSQYSILASMALALSALLGPEHALFMATFLLFGIIYNSKPFRFKDRRYIDVILESANNPLRFLFGWYIISNEFPASSAVFGYWAIGAYMMCLKRYSEKKHTFSISTPNSDVNSYRASLAKYTESELLEISFFYALVATSMYGVFIGRYSPWMIASFPSVAFFIIEYFRLASKPNSSVENPETLFREKRLLFSLLILCLASILPLVLTRTLL